MESLSQIALTLVPGLGNTSIRRLVDLYPDDDPFSLPASELKTVFANHPAILGHIQGKTSFPRAEQEMAFCEKNGIRPLFFTSPDYPERLNRAETEDCPALLYVMGTANLNPGQLTPFHTPIVSGLAYGIDTAAHTAALDHSLPTVAVLGHGLDRIYPAENRPLAKRILEASGALVTEYPSGTAINPRYFPARNRIIAALGDATVVVEASEKGGALITAAIAASYHRDVFALPGRLSDTYSRGTINLIATNRALLARNADDIAFQLGWPLVGQQATLEGLKETPRLSPDEQKIADALRNADHLTLDEIARTTSFSLPRAAGILFNMEMAKQVRTLPGHLYQLINK